MYTDTHALLLAAATGCYYRERLTPRIVCAGAACLPDFAMVAECGLRWLKGERVYEADVWSVFTNDYTKVTHSFFLVIILVFLALPFFRNLWVKMFMIGWLSHPVIDVFTHGRTDALYVWPSTYSLGQVFGVLDYRLEGLSRTWWELGLDVALAAVVIYQTCCWWREQYKNRRT